MSGEQIRKGYTPRRFEDEDYPSVRIAPDFDGNRRHLYVLSLVYYVVALVFGLCGCGLAALLATALRDRYPFELASCLIYGAIFFTLTNYGAMAGALVVVVRSLAVQQRYTLCLVMSIVLLFNGIFGIPLGVWTLIVLMRRSVKDLFDRSSAVLELSDRRIALSRTDGDKKCLRILSNCYIVAAAGMILVGLWFTAGAILGLWITFTDDFGARSSGGPSQSDMALRDCIVVTCAGVVWVLVVCLIRAARSLRELMRYAFCVVIAAIICALPPLGTALGVATLLVLAGDSVKYLFEHSPDTN
jgi:hypothetical protein